jgi:hypothetical protein
VERYAEDAIAGSRSGGGWHVTCQRVHTEPESDPVIMVVLLVRAGASCLAGATFVTLGSCKMAGQSF